MNNEATDQCNCEQAQGMGSIQAPKASVSLAAQEALDRLKAHLGIEVSRRAHAEDLLRAMLHLLDWSRRPDCDRIDFGIQLAAHIRMAEQHLKITG